MTLEQFYNKNKEHVVAIYLAGSKIFGIESQHDVDYAVFCRDAADSRTIVGDIEWLKRSVDRKVDVFIHYVGEVHRPVFWLVHEKYWKLLFGEPVELYDVLEHRGEQVALLKNLVKSSSGKIWASIYVLLKVLQRNSYQLTEEDYTVIKSIYKNRDAFPEQKEIIYDAAASLE